MLRCIGGAISDSRSRSLSALSACVARLSLDIVVMVVILNSVAAYRKVRP